MVFLTSEVPLYVVLGAAFLSEEKLRAVEGGPGEDEVWKPGLDGLVAGREPEMRTSISWFLP